MKLIWVGEKSMGDPFWLMSHQGWGLPIEVGTLAEMLEAANEPKPGAV